MVPSFKDKETENVWSQMYSKKLPRDIQKMGLRKLIMLHRTKDLYDLRVPPGSKLEQLTGNREGQHSIRTSNQWRICFSWNGGVVTDIEIVDYHLEDILDRIPEVLPGEIPHAAAWINSARSRAIR